MAINHLFQIEATRKVSISIPGYDPVCEMQKLEKKFKRIRERNARRQSQSAQQQEEAKRLALRAQETALEELRQAQLRHAHAHVVATAQTETDNLFA
jgi:hypothetical protein